MFKNPTLKGFFQKSKVWITLEQKREAMKLLNYPLAYLFIFLGLTTLGLFIISSCNSTLPTQETPLFQAEVLDSTIQIGYGLAIGDVNGDQRPDILLADKKQFVWYRNPDWQRFVMIDSLTQRDNVCIAARDINGDGQVEVAVGAQWNPRETVDSTQSGSVHYLLRPDDPTQLWDAIPLHHEPTVHRMHWVQLGNEFDLVVLPLHGVGNRGGLGAGVKIWAYRMPEDPHEPWAMTLLDSSMHLTHNFDVIRQDGREALLVGGKEGAKLLTNSGKNWYKSNNAGWAASGHGFGEIRKYGPYMAGIQPLHGHELVLYGGVEGRKVLSDELNQGHALAIGPFIDNGNTQIIVGWRNENDEGHMGIKLFETADSIWTNQWIDRDGIACEDLKVADLNGDSKVDIIAAGRSTHNLKVYWQQ